MRLIIDIPRKVNEHIRSWYGHGYFPQNKDDRNIIAKAIYNGTPIPDNATNGEDAISRKAVLNTVERMYKACDGIMQEYHDLLVSCVEDLLSVQPEQKTGHWIPIYQGDEIINYCCSECELGDTNGSTNLYGWDYCRRCGAEMT